MKLEIARPNQQLKTDWPENINKGICINLIEHGLFLICPLPLTEMIIMRLDFGAHLLHSQQILQLN